MSSGTQTPPPAAPKPPPAPPPRNRPDPYEAFIEQRIHQARRHVKWVDLATGLLILSIGGLAYLLIAAVIDQWLVPGGLGFWGRLLMLLGLLAGAGWYLFRVVLPPLVYRINPLFAAETLERSRPSLKNSLINFLLLRGHRREVHRAIYQALEQRAASDLSQVELEVAVDRTRVFRLGYVLAGLVALCGLYLVLSPKNPFVSAGRVIWPWARIAPPTRVKIDNIDPGDATVYHGDTLTVSADVSGLADDETPTLYYSTVDGQVIDRPVTMTLPEEGFRRYEYTLPADPDGFQQDVVYFLDAGDCTTERFRVDVQTAPAIVVDSIEYDYPAYTGLGNRRVEKQGDVRGIEGTRVIVRATANRPINRAEIDLGCDDRRGLRMQVEETRAAGRFTLRLDPEDPLLPEYSCYQLRLTDQNGRINPRPIRHRIEVIPDLPPTVELLEPEKEEVQLAEDGELLMRVRAEDPDLALRSVALRAERSGRDLEIPPLLDGAHQGEFIGEYLFRPSELGLKAGDRVRYFAEAEDNKENERGQPAPGRAETDPRWITIVGPEVTEPAPGGAGGLQEPGAGLHRPVEPPPEEALPPEEPTPEPPAGTEQAASPAAPPEPGDEPPAGDEQPPEDQQGGSDGDGAPGAEGTPDSKPGGAEGAQDQPADQPIDGETNPGDAFEKIQEHSREQQSQSDEPQSGQPQSGQPQSGQPQSGQPQSGQPQSGQPQSGQPQSGQPQSGQPQSGQPQSGQPQSGQPQSGQPQSGQPQSGQPQSGQPQSGQPQSGQPESGQPQSGQPESGQPQSGQPPSGQPESGQPQSGHPQSGQPQPGQPQAGEPQSGQRQPGEQQTESAGQGDQQQQTPGAGSPSQPESTGSPAPQEDNRERPKQPGSGGESQGNQQDSSKSPSTSPRQSDSESDTSGDRSGGGGEGGGQRSDKQGTGAAGSQTDADRGGSKSQQKGEGETGTRAGDQVESDRPTGHSERRPGEGGSGRTEQRPGGAAQGATPQERPGDPNTEPGTPIQNPTDGGQPGERVSEGPGARGYGDPTAGGRPRPTPPPEGPDATTEPGGDDPNLDYAQKAVDMSLEHLRDQLNRGDKDLLDRLGWTDDQARRFLNEWEQLGHQAQRPGRDGEAAREAFKSLGLKPRRAGVRSTEGSTDAQSQRESGRFDPPSGWADYFKAYTRGVAREGRE